MERILSGVATAADLRYASALLPWSKLALDRSLGLPPRGVIEKPQRDPVVFVSRPTIGQHVPWCWAVDTARRVELGYRPDIAITHEGECSAEPPAALQAPPDAKSLRAAEVIEATKTGDTSAEDLAGGDSLELVDPGYDPSAPREHGDPQPPGRVLERDRPKRDPNR